jgi:hypothetical protein
MSNSKRKCKKCGNHVREYVVINNMAFCTFEAAVKYASANKAKGAKIKQKEQKKKDVIRKKELMTRTEWYTKLKTYIHRYIVHVRDKDKGCYTCGKTSTSVKYDAGHRHHAGRGGGDRRRFMPENIHKQCSVNCNQHGSGMPVEYDKALNKEYGKGFAEHLSCVANYPTLKELFPTHYDIELEIKRRT